MSMYPVHTIESAPEGSREALAALRRGVGMIPNLAASMAESPTLLRGFAAAREIFQAGTFTPAETQVLALTNAFENGCTYCMALHSAFALRVGVPEESVRALRSGEPPADPRLGALADMSRKLVRARGHVAEEDVRAFVAAGYTPGQALEVVLGVAVSVMANYAHQLTHCPIDEVFLPAR